MKQQPQTPHAESNCAGLAQIYLQDLGKNSCVDTFIVVMQSFCDLPYNDG